MRLLFFFALVCYCQNGWTGWVQEVQLQPLYKTLEVDLAHCAQDESKEIFELGYNETYIPRFERASFRLRSFVVSGA